MKKCSKCKNIKDLHLFSNSKNSKDGKNPRCRECLSDDSRKYYLKNLDRISLSNKKRREENPDYMKLYYIENTEKIKNSNKKYYIENRDELLIIGKEYYNINKDYISKYKKDFYIENKESILEYKKQYYIENKESRLEYNKKYYDENSELLIKNGVNWKRNKLKTDDIYRFDHSVRNLIKSSIRRKNNIKNENSDVILGISFNEFRLYLESKFEDWMTWDNYGLYNGELNYGWDIDHIIPISSAETEDDIIKLNHYTNLQPLCSKINRYVKRNKCN